MITLKYEADVLVSQFGPLLLSKLVDWLLEKIELAGPRAVVHAKDVKESRFTGAGGPHYRDEFSRLDIYVTRRSTNVLPTPDSKNFSTLRIAIIAELLCFET